MLRVVAPSDQRYVSAPIGASSQTPLPAQKDVDVRGVMVAFGSARTVTAVAALCAVQPAAFVTVTR
jgi:hypothetical protein